MNNRYKVTLDNNIDLTLYEDVILKYNLLINKSIEEKDLDKKTLIRMIDDIFDDTSKYQKVKENVSKLGIKDSYSRIYNILKEMILNDKKFY